MSIDLVEKEKKSSKSFFRAMGGRLSKRFVTAGDDSLRETVENLGMTTITDGNSNISYVVVANYAKKSTEENPIIEVRLHYNGESISKLVYITSINPKKATMLEMFALCCYADDANIYKGENTTSFQQLKGYVHNAAMHGLCKIIPQYKDFFNKKADWDRVINSVKDIYLADAVYDQYQGCLKLMDLFDYFYEKRECTTSK